MNSVDCNGFENLVGPSRRFSNLDAAGRLTSNATIEDAIERLVFLAKIETGLAELDRSEGVPHDEAKQRFGL